MSRYFIMRGDDVAAGPISGGREACWNAQQEVLEDTEPEEWDTVRPVREWAVTENHDDGTIYLTNVVKQVTAFLSHGHEGWNAGLFDETKERCPIIEGSELFNVTRGAALCHLLSLVQHVDEYSPDLEKSEAEVEQ